MSSPKRPRDPVEGIAQRPEQPAAKKELAEPQGATLVGWSFWSLALQCWHAFALRYLMGLQPAVQADYFSLGAAYHALLEGRSHEEISRWGIAFLEALPEAQRLYEARLKDGPKLPPAKEIEKTHHLRDIPMTSRPDREEPGSGIEQDKSFATNPFLQPSAPTENSVRDYKTAAFFGKDDQAFWDVNGEIIGEMLAGGVQHATVDVINKSNGETKIVEVKLTPVKAAALKALILDLEAQLRARLKGAASKNGGALQNFPRSLQCIGKYGKCKYYDFCWGGRINRMAYSQVDVKPWWRGLADGREDMMKISIAVHDTAAKLKQELREELKGAP